MKTKNIVALLLSLIVCSCSTTTDARVPTPSTVEASPPSISQDEKAHIKVLSAMEKELNRAKTTLKIDDYQLPYFIAYRLIDTESVSVSGKYGAVDDVDKSRDRSAYVEVRVGDYTFDNFANIDSQSYRFTEREADSDVPYGVDEDAIRGTFWRMTDQEYKRATSAYLTKKGGAIYETDEKKSLASFSKETPEVEIGKVKPFVFDTKKWEKVVADVTKKFMNAEPVLDASMVVSGNRSVRYFISSEGSKLLESRVIYAIHISASTRAPDGMMLDNSRSLYSAEYEKLPTEKELYAKVDEVIANLKALQEAPTVDPYTGPAILMPEASGVLFHEAVGHRLEGERQRDDEEGQTFKGRVGKVVLPKFLTVYDDPTIAMSGTTALNGTYDYDDEGVKAQHASLIKDGVLTGFLKSRTPIEGSQVSNGHGRASGISKPMARMANLFVVASKDKQMPMAELKKQLIAEVKRQKKPFGLIIKDITGGSTNTSGYGYQAFKGTPQLIYKVDPETGAETLVRGAELVGTPLTSINKIVAASDEVGVFNGYCGAESGWVPVSAVAPALLTTEVELQRTQSPKERKPILDAPWKADSKTSSDSNSKGGAASKASAAKK